MRQKIDCFLTCDNIDDIKGEIACLRDSRTIQHIYLLTADANMADDTPEGCVVVETDRPTSSSTIRNIAALATAEYVLFLTKATPLTIGQTALERMLRVASVSPPLLSFALIVTEESA